MTEYVTRTKTLIVLPDGEPIFSERATEIYIEDDAGGEYVVIDQSGNERENGVAVWRSDWPAIRDAVEKLLGECQS